MNAVPCVIVVWSRSSVVSERVREAALRAHERGVLVAVRIEKVEPPATVPGIAFGDLTDWTGRLNALEFLVVAKWVEELVPAKTRNATRRIDPAVAHPGRPGDDRPVLKPDTAPRGGLPAAVARTGANDAPQTPPHRMGRVTSTLFLCYRREDTQDAAGRLHDRLADTYGRERVFMDIDSVPLGIDFVDHVTEQIARCSAVIVMIGKQWLRAKDKKRRRRLDNEDDLVRAEIRAALCQNVPVIPVIVQNASMPVADDLPEDIRPLARRNGIQLRPEQWREGIERLLKELDKVMKA